MTFMLTTQAVERCRHTIQAAEVFHDQARTIAHVCADAERSDVVVAAVARDGRFTGAWTVPGTDLTAQVERLDSDGWVLLFSPAMRIDEIERRAVELARLAFRRWEAMRRWASRHA